jgi:hypothetical protein
MSPVSSNFVTIQGSKLNKAIKDNKSADAFVHYLALRKRGRGFTDVNRLVRDLEDEKFKMDPKSLLTFLKLLENDGLGSVVNSRKFGGAPRFLWKYDMRKVCEAAINGKDVIAPELPKDQQRVSDASRKHKNKSIKVVSVSKHEPKIKMPLIKLEKPNSLNINGDNYIKMTEEEYNKLNKMMELFNEIKSK